MSSQIRVDRFLRSKLSHQYDLHAYEKLLLFILASYMGEKSMCYPSLNLLASECSISTDSVKRHINLLEKKKLIKVVRNIGRNNSYILSLPSLEKPSADSTWCSKHLDANSTTYPERTAPTPGADSPPNNISNNIKECTSSNICEVETSPVCSSSSTPSTADIQEIFRYWQDVMGHPKAKLDKKRSSAIQNALKLGFSIDDLKKAIEGCKNTPFNMGKNDNYQVHDGVRVIFRDAEQIERFMNNADKTHKPSGTDDLMAGVI